MKSKTLKITSYLIGMILSITTFLVNAQTLRPFKATYTIKLHGLTVGKASRILKIDQNKHYQFIFKLDSTFPLVNLKATQISEGLWTYKGPHPSTYTYHYKLFTKVKNIVSYFNWLKSIAKTVRDKKSYTVGITKNSQDRLSYQLAIRQDLINRKELLAYDVIGKKTLHFLLFRRTGYQILKTPFGRFRTIKLIQINRKHKDDRVIFWVAPRKYDYLLIKIIEYKNGSISSEADLKSIKWL